MTRTTIHYKKKHLVPMLILLTVSAIPMAWYAVGFLKTGEATIMGVLSVGVILYLLYNVFMLTRKLWRADAVIEMDELGFSYDPGRRKFAVLWHEIISWKVEKDGSEYLVLSTASGKKKINLAWLEMKPAEILEIFRQRVEKKLPSNS